MKASLSDESKDRLESGILSTARVGGLTHNFYRYPARFSPEFVRAAVQEFTKEGDLVYDPFVGGGTTLVEAAALGRSCIGTDISSLASFISKTKTTIFSDEQLAGIEQWANTIAPLLSAASASVPTSHDEIRVYYQRNINGRTTWRIRKLLEIGLSSIESLDDLDEQCLARCILLKTGQWALDCRSEVPSTKEFQTQLISYAEEMVDAAHEFSSLARRYSPRPKVMCVHRSAIGIEQDSRFQSLRNAKLVLTSPPYPGLHVLYHRWQVMGRKETAAPFWIAGTQDGDGGSFYTFGDRKQAGLGKYFENVLAAFTSIHAAIDQQALVVQMVAFSAPEWQLPKYLEAMSMAGFAEERISMKSQSSDGRVWRSVPGRKWYASMMGKTGGSQEVVLFHRKTLA